MQASSDHPTEPAQQVATTAGADQDAVTDAPSGQPEARDPGWLKVVTAVVCLMPFAIVAALLVPGGAEDERLDDVSRKPLASQSAATEEGSARPTPTPGVESSDMPQVKDLRRADFSRGDSLPDGAATFDSGNRTGLEVGARGLTHGPPVGERAVGYLETRLAREVTKIGTEVSFGGDGGRDSGVSGTVALTAWTASVVAASAEGERRPTSGMRLVADPDSWRLERISGGRLILGEGTYDLDTSAPARFVLVRSEDRLWLKDPTGAITEVSNPAVATLAGKWVSWELAETRGQSPATLVKVWAG